MRRLVKAGGGCHSTHQVDKELVEYWYEYKFHTFMY
jgi:hypothetical protein